MATTDDVVNELQNLLDAVATGADRVEDAVEVSAEYVGNLIGEVTGAIVVLHGGLAEYFRDVIDALRQSQPPPPGQVPRGGQTPGGGDSDAPTRARRGPGAADKAQATVGAMLGQLTGALAPLALFGAALQSATSGFGPFLQSVKLVGVTLGGILMPSLVVLTGAVYALTALLAGELNPALASFYGDTIRNLVLEMGMLEEVVGGLTASLGVLNLTAKERGKLMAGLGTGGVGSLLGAARTAGLDPKKSGLTESLFAGGLPAILSAVRRARGEQAPTESAAVRGAGVRPDDNKAELDRSKSAQRAAQSDFAKLTLDGMKMAAQEMRRAIGGQGGFTGVAAAHKEVTTAGLNMSPFERKMLEIQQNQLAVLERVLGEMNRPQAEPAR